MEAVIVKELRKSYNTFPALDGISFSMRQGEVFGLLGPNDLKKTMVGGLLLMWLLKIYFVE